MNKLTHQAVVKWSLYILLAFLMLLMLKIVLTYVNLDTDVGFLRIKQQYVDNQFWLTSFFIHAFTSIFCLFAGFTQFSERSRIRKPELHKTLGKLYIISVLFLSAPSGFVLGLFANGHLPSRIGFCLLAVLWFGFTTKAWLEIRKRNITAHQKFMIRSYALALSAITLRLWKLGLAKTFEPNPLDLYQLVTWLGFIPNMLIAELIIYRRGHTT